MVTKHFAVTMHCSSCAMVLEGLEDHPGIDRVHADYRAHRVEVTYDEQLLSTEAVLDAIRSEGYEATPA